jgi:diguanylate cyclase (GGDEF)-like protein/PAS domain S-box-containing protein
MIKRLVVGTLLINLFFFALAAWSIYQSQCQYQERAEITTQNLVRVLEEDINGDIDKIDIALLSVKDEVRRHIAAGGIDAKALNLFLAQLQEHQPEALSLRATDAEGVARYGVGVSPQGGPNNSDREYFIRSRDESPPGLIMTKPMLTRLDKKWAIVLARRLSKPDGSFAGVVYVNVTLEYFNKIFSKINVGQHGSVTLRDKDLGLVVRYPEPLNLDYVIGSKPSIQLQKLIQSGRSSGTFRTLTPLDNVERTLSYRKISDKPFYIIVGEGVDDYLAVWRQEAANTVALMLFFFLTTLLSSRLIYRFWKRQIDVSETMREQKDFLDAILESEPECVKVLGRTGALLQMNRAGLAMLEVESFQEAEKLGLLHFVLPEYRDAFLSLSQRVLGGESGTLEFQIEGKKGTKRWLDTHAKPLLNAKNEITALVAVTRDITDRKFAEEQVQQLAYFDSLTKLPNRRLLLDRLHHALAATARTGSHGALLFIDLDNFKMLNDTLGHDAGDLLLQQVAQRLASCVRDGDTVARLGGDEFVVMLEDLSEKPEEASTQTKTAGEKILATLNQTYLLAGHDHHSTPSIGATQFNGHQNSVEELLKQADLAMYQAKEAGRNTLRFFDPDMQAAVMARATLVVDLRKAIVEKQFLLYYQAQVAASRQVIGAEALVRWQHPERGLVSPVEFLHLTEETGLIQPLGLWVLETACAQLAAWATQPNMAHLTLAVNISAQQFRRVDFVDQVLAALDHTGANPQRLKLELTESLLVEDGGSIINKMTALKDKCINFSLDGFGTGYSSLEFLKRLPLDQLKIDQSFVHDLLTNPNDAAIARTVVALGLNFGLSVIAEGVETETQRDFLANNSCLTYQGYLFSRPLPLAEFETFVTRVSHSPEGVWI